MLFVFHAACVSYSPDEAASSIYFATYAEKPERCHGCRASVDRSSEPIFPVADVVATVRYCRDVLGFEKDWVWGEPPDFGGVRWGKVV